MSGMSSSARHEKRRYFRGKARPGRRVDLHYRLVDAERDTRVAAVTSNIGVGGAFILTDTPPALGTLLAIDINVPTADNLIHVTGEVRWTSEEEEEDAGMGVKFLNLDVEALLELSEYFASLTGAEPDAVE